MDFKKGLIAGAIGGVAMIIVGALYTSLASLFVDFSGAVFRSMDPILPWLFKMGIVQLVSGAILGFLYAIFFPLLKVGWLERGAVLGLIGWLFALPMLAMTYVAVQVPMAVIITWAIGVLIQFIAGGVVISRAYGEGY